jgi:hypothetical protein
VTDFGPQYVAGPAIVAGRGAWVVRDTIDNGKIIASYCDRWRYPYINWAQIRARWKAWSLNTNNMRGI